MSDIKKKEEEERAPIVAILGHIDHGKSTLLDFIRKTNVVEHEAGGITQHVNAYEINHTTKEKKNVQITFIDTPGHAAFIHSRERGANIADIAIIIISAEEGVKEQTLESLKMVQKIKVPYIIAINKIDRANADINKVKNQLVENGFYVEGYGGDIPCVSISAKTGAGIDELLDVITLLSEIEELNGVRSIPAYGFILESNVDSKVGITAILIIKNGTLYQGDYFVYGRVVSKVKRLESYNNIRIKKASLSQPVYVFGLSKIANAGESFTTFKNKKDADKFVKELGIKNNKEDNISKDEDDKRLLFPLVIKTDVMGTLEALMYEINKLSTDMVRVKILRSGVGNITEKDIKLAESAKNTLVIGFNLKIDKAAKDLAYSDDIKIIIFNIIYKVTEFLREEITSRTPKIKQEECVGSAKVIRLFSETKKAQVIGAKVLSGKITNSAMLKIIRNDNEIGEGKIIEMQKERVKVKDASKGDQFGATISRKTNMSIGDELQAFTVVEK